MKNHLVALIVLFLLPIGILAQDLPTIVPPSPEAASLGKFTEVPISHYTGLPNISVPITSFEVGGKSFPVSISYHARGVRVEEIASRVGIGWALSAGGQISRQTRDQPDDGPGGYLGSSNILMDNLGETASNQGFFGSLTVRDDYRSQDANNTYKPDRHPDQFSLQAGGLSAKFIFDYKDDKPLIQSYNDIVITNNNGLESFTVTDKDGFKYYFGVSKDLTRTARNWDKNIGNYEFFHVGGYNLTSSTFNLAYNSWLLMDVESPSGKLVSFVYEEQVSQFYRRSYDKKINDNPIQISSFVTKTESHQYQLKEIIHDGGKIEFEASNLRQDLKSAFSNKKSYELDKVKIFDNNNDLVKSFELYQSYPSTVIDNNQNSQLKIFEPESAKRLRLDSIAEIGRNNISKPSHTFTYNSQELPNRFSNSQDLWGYYNGADNGQFLLFNDGSYGNVDRTINLSKSMAGIIERITYPTGGSTKFTYEHNKGVLGTEYNHIEFPAVNPTTSRSESISHLATGSYITENGNSFYSKDIIINDTYGLVQFDVSLPTINGTNHNVACANPVQSGCGFDIKLQGINGTPHDYNYIYAGQNAFFVEAGEYRLIVDPASFLNWNPNPLNVYPFSVILSWDEQTESQDDILYASGKRIKKIEFLDSGNNLVSNKEYSYLNIDNSQSGIILGVSSFGSIHPNFTMTNFNVFEMGSAFPGSPFTTYQGNSIGYKTVTEYYGDKNSNHGKTVYDFTVHKDSGDYMSYPITPPTDNEWLRGLPKTIAHYKKDSNSNYKKVKSTVNNYRYGDIHEILPVIFTPETDRRDLVLNLADTNILYDKTDTFYRLPLINLYHPYNNDGSSNVSDIYYKTYHFTGGTIGNFKSTETLYDDTVTPTLVTETETEFNYAQHYQPSKVTSVTSDGEPVIQTFTYPQDETNPTGVVNDLVLANRHVPLEVKTFKDFDDDGVAETAEQTSITKTTYFDWGNNVIEPTKIQIGKGPSPTLVDRIDFKDYDADGNLLHVSKADGMDIIYLYGYDKTLPVAKIENATYSQISSTIRADIETKSNLDDDHCQDAGSCDEKNLRTALNALRTVLPNAMITTYTYDPLIGITSMTDPKGYTVYYEYDDLNRLVRVIDEDGKIMSENAYHYLLDN